MPGPDDPQGTDGSKPVQNFQPSTRHVGTGPDTDGDGLSDDFETNVFFSDPNAVDPDGDGLNDWAEYWVDTNPKVADTDGDGFLDGEDLAFGDPLAVNAGGAARTALRDQARRLFDAEGSDQDKDWVRDYLEVSEGTKKDSPDSDGDGLSDGVEMQMRVGGGITTSQHSTPDDTTDLDEARAKLGERRWEAEQQRQGSSSSLDESTDGVDGTMIAGEPYGQSDLEQPAFEQPAFEQPAYDEPADEAPSFSEAPVEDTMIADAGDTSSDGSSDSWA